MNNIIFQTSNTEAQIIISVSNGNDDNIVTNLYCKNKDFTILKEISKECYHNALHENVFNLYSCSLNQQEYKINYAICEFNYFMIYSKLIRQLLFY